SLGIYVRMDRNSLLDESEQFLNDFLRSNILFKIPFTVILFLKHNSTPKHISEF
ncbi:hypothetical protein L9F63_010230, partial [Diploptera punctata]